MKLLVWVDAAGGITGAKTRVFLENGVELKGVRSMSTTTIAPGLFDVTLGLFSVDVEMIEARPACVVDDLIGCIEMLVQGIEWNIEHHPKMMNQSDEEAVAEAKEMVKKARAGS